MSERTPPPPSSSFLSLQRNGSVHIRSYTVRVGGGSACSENTSEGHSVTAPVALTQSRRRPAGR